MQRVLLVDDARLLAELEGTALGRRSLVCRAVSSDNDVLAEALALRPDLILLEEGEFCPEALDVARRLAAHSATRSIPVVYIGSPLHRERALGLGVRVFVPRPITGRALREALDTSGLISDRASLRRRVDVPAEFTNDGGLPLPVRCIDLSLGGALIDLDGTLAVGSRGVLAIDSPPRRIELPATVVRCGGGYAIQFDLLSLAEAAYFSRFVRRAGERRQSMQADATATSGELR